MFGTPHGLMMLALCRRVLGPALPLLLLGAPVTAADVSKLPPPAARKVDYAKDIQPIFASTCYSCHGEKKQQSGFRLDRKADALKGGEIGQGIVPGKSAESPLIHYVAGIDPDVKMPPKGEPLTAEQVGLLRAWIDQGAEWPDIGPARDPKAHWAFKAPVRPPLPKVSNPAWARTPIDAFILARLDKEGIKPSPEADKITLLRRLHLDLIGLPPTTAEADAFLADQSPNAYEKAVERLLKSPHYGERWGRHWLDAARYADSDGYEKDKSRQVWFYRDWVVNAFNRDLPYDQFVREQIAGDLLPKATQEQIVATGFLRNSMLNEEGGVDPEQFRMDGMFDRMDALGKAVLGLTIACAQCHNHKFDPVTQEEYYKLFAYLNNDHEAQRVVYTPEEQQKIADIRRVIGEIEGNLRHTTPDWQDRMAKWEESVKVQPNWEVLPLTNLGDNSQRYIEQPDRSILCQGYAPTKFSTDMRAKPTLKTITGFRIELLNDPNLPCNGPGRSFLGTCALSEFKVDAFDPKEPGKKVAVKFVKATADYGNPERELEPNFDDKSKKKRVTGPVAYAIDGKDDTAWGIDAGPGRRNVPRNAVFVPEKPVSLPNGVVLDFHLKQMHGGWNSDDHMNNNLGRFRLSVTGDPDPAADPLPKHVRHVLGIAKDKRTPEQLAAVFSYWRTTVPEWKAENDRIEAEWKKWPVGSTQLTFQAREEKRPTAILKRGDFLKPTKPVGAGVPTFLHPLRDPKADGSRLTLANWLVDRDSPTTARVFVNRVWQAYFGTGLVATPEDFGLQSEKPSHPKLLDWLAVEFMDRGWSVKHLHRLIVNSAAYRQSSKVTPELFSRDQYNRLLARAPRLRVEGEIVRDIALHASGLLNPTVGGPSLFSPAPAFLFVPPASYGPFNWIEVQGNDRYRRALYTFRRRSTPYPVFTNFDVPNADSSCVKRVRSNTPLQALTLLNESVFMDCARALAVRALTEGGKTDAERIAFAFRCCTSRAPDADETAELVKLLAAERERLAKGEVNANELSTGDKDPKKKLPAEVTAPEAAAYTVVARVLLNLDETITKE
jgi:mono/diheme cytochrome c family protein